MRKTYFNYLEFSNLENYKNKNENIPYLEQQNQKHLEQQFQSSKFENHKEINHFAKQKVDEGEISKRKNLNIAQFNNQINEKKNVIYPQSEKQLKKPVEKGFIARNQIIFVFGVVVIFIIIAFYFTI